MSLEIYTLATLWLANVSDEFLELVTHRTNITLANAPYTSPKPLSTVPFRRDPDFVDRGDILAQIDQRCSQPGGRAALFGLGGVG